MGPAAKFFRIDIGLTRSDFSQYGPVDKVKLVQVLTDRASKSFCRREGDLIAHLFPDFKSGHTPGKRAASRACPPQEQGFEMFLLPDGKGIKKGGGGLLRHFIRNKLESDIEAVFLFFYLEKFEICGDKGRIVEGKVLGKTEKLFGGIEFKLLCQNHLLLKGKGTAYIFKPCGDSIKHLYL